MSGWVDGWVSPFVHPPTFNARSFQLTLAESSTIALFAITRSHCMGHERLLLAGILLGITRMITCIAAPTPVTLLIDSSQATAILVNQGRSIQSALPENLPASIPQPPLQVAEAEKSAENPVSSESNTAATANDCRKVGTAVVTVHAGREIGSGSIISSDGLVITNHHVVRRLRNRPLLVETLSGTQVEGEVIAVDRRHDLALLRLKTQESLPIVPLASTDSPEIGQSVCAIGSPFGQPGKTTEGKLTSILPNGDLESNVVLKPGNSGGPLLNAQGEMIGVNKGVERSPTSEGDRKSFATNLSVTREFIEQNRANHSADDISPVNSLPENSSSHPQPRSLRQ